MAEEKIAKFGSSGVFAMRCPNCGKGDLFEGKLSLKMPKNCAVCNQDYWPEPGFYYGAMFIGYIVTAFVFVILSLILVFAFDTEVNLALFLVFVFAAVSYVFFFRLARSIWIHIAIQPGKQ